MSDKKVTVGEVIEEIGMCKQAYLAFAILSLAMLLDGFDYAAVAYTMTQISAEWGLDGVATGSLSSWSMAGMAIGAIVGGVFADKLGRKKTLVVSIFLFGLSTTFVYFAPGYTFFAICRVFTGIMLGCLTPLAVSLISELMPFAKRAFFVPALCSCMALGGLLAGACGIFLMPVFGWRFVYLVSACAMIVAIIMFFLIPESPKWLVSKGRNEEACKVLQKMADGSKNAGIEVCADNLVDEQRADASAKPSIFAGLFKGDRQAFNTIGLWLMYFCSSFILYGVSIWLPSLLMYKGFSLTGSYAFNMAQQFAGIFAGIVIGAVAVKIGRKKAIIVAYVAAALGVTFMAFVPGSMMFVAAMFMGLVINTISPAINNVASELYRTEARSTGVSFMQSVGRIAGAVAPVVTGALVSMELSYSAAMMVFTIPCALGVVFVLIFVHKTITGEKL